MLLQSEINHAPPTLTLVGFSIPRTHSTLRQNLHSGNDLVLCSQP